MGKHIKNFQVVGLAVWAMGMGVLVAKPERHPKYEPVEWTVGAKSKNVFANAKVSASGHWDKQVPEYAVDGKVSQQEHWACEGMPVWHQVELAQVKTLSAIHAWPYWGDGRIYQYRIEGSEDGKVWKVLGDKSANSIESTEEGDVFRFAPTAVKYVKTTFSKNSLGAAKGGHLVEIQGFEQIPEGAMELGVGTTDLRYPPQGEIAGLLPMEKGLSWSAWKGERVNGQLVIRATQVQKHVRFGESFVMVAGKRMPVGVKFIRYTQADGKPYGDIIDDQEMLDLEAGANRPVWVEWEVPRGVAAGEYRGQVEVLADGDRKVVPLKVEVLAKTLPEPKDWKFHLDIWQHPEAVARWHDVKAWSKEHLALMKPGMIRLAQAGQKTITCSIIEEAWGEQTYDRFPSMVEWRKKADGTWVYDYQKLDQWIDFMSKECGLAQARIHCYSMLPWSLKFRYYDEKEGRYVDQALTPGSAEYDAYWGRFLEDFSKHMKARGDLERVRIGIDERPDPLLKGAFATMKKHAPWLKVASAINHPSEMNKDIDDLSPIIGNAYEFSREVLEERRKAGKKTTVYVCCAPRQPNTFTFSPPAESEWLPIFAIANGFDGFLRWAYQSWVENPLKSTDFTSWPSGDCFMIYPGDRSSVRFEKMREGIETYEKIRVLQDEMRSKPDAKKAAAMAEVERVLKDFTSQRGMKGKEHAQDVRRLNEAVDKASRE